jgi:hypothetical protein
MPLAAKKKKKNSKKKANGKVQPGGDGSEVNGSKEHPVGGDDEDEDEDEGPEVAAVRALEHSSRTRTDIGTACTCSGTTEDKKQSTHAVVTS